MQLIELMGMSSSHAQRKIRRAASGVRVAMPIGMHTEATKAQAKNAIFRP